MIERLLVHPTSLSFGRLLGSDSTSLYDLDGLEWWWSRQWWWWSIDDDWRSLAFTAPLTTTLQNVITADAADDLDEDARDAFTAEEVFELIRNLNDPEHPLTLEQLKVATVSWSPLSFECSTCGCRHSCHSIEYYLHSLRMYQWMMTRQWSRSASRPRSLIAGKPACIMMTCQCITSLEEPCLQ